MASEDDIEALTDSDLLSIVETGYLTIEEGDDYVIEDATFLPYEYVRKLGHGSSGTVEKVRHQVTGEVYARKTFLISHIRERKSKQRVFVNELNNIRSLGGHPHFVRVFASYTTREELALILLPVADTDLARMLVAYSDLKQNTDDSSFHAMTAILKQCFGCLLSALAFMSESRIRHKDIKPSNILIYNGLIVYTDFGSSLLSESHEGSTTQGHPGGVTWQYCAPEVHGRSSRNSKTDVYSLGCVFIEILAVLIEGLRWDKSKYFYEQMRQLHEQLVQLYIPIRFLKLIILPNIIISMTTELAKDRLTANDICCDILREPIFGCPGCKEQLDAFQKIRCDLKKLEATVMDFEQTKETMAPRGGQQEGSSKMQSSKKVSSISHNKSTQNRGRSSRAGSQQIPATRGTSRSNVAGPSIALQTRRATSNQNYEQVNNQLTPSSSPRDYTVRSRHNEYNHQGESQHRFSGEAIAPHGERIQEVVPFNAQYTHGYDYFQPYNPGNYGPRDTQDARSHSSIPNESDQGSERRVSRTSGDDESSSQGSWMRTAASEFARLVAIGGAIEGFDAWSKHRSINSLIFISNQAAHVTSGVGLNSTHASESPTILDSATTEAASSPSHPTTPTRSQIFEIPEIQPTSTEISEVLNTSELATTHSTSTSSDPTISTHSAYSSDTTISPYATEPSYMAPKTTPILKGGWTWDPLHEDYYRVEHFQNGNHKYIWSKDTKTLRPNVVSAMPKGPERRKLSWIRGLYDPSKGPSQENLHYESFHPGFYVREKTFFSVGKVFAVLFTSASINYLPDYDSSTSIVELGSALRYHIKRLVVVRVKEDCCYACPLRTYNGRGTTKPGIRLPEHAVVYSHGCQPALLPDETPSKEQYVCVVMLGDEPPLHAATRINFAVYYPVERTIKVKELGYVHPDYMAYLVHRWQDESKDDSAEGESTLD